MDLNGRSAIVTGGARGIGLRAVAALLERGANVTMTATTDEGLAKARERLGNPEALTTVASDLTTVAGCQAVAQHALEAFGAIDVLFTNAGLYSESSVEETTEEFWNKVVDSNLKSTFFTIQAALPALREAKGVIVTMASYNGVDGIRGNVAVYGAAKAGVINMTRALALDLAPDVRVNTIAPGFIETETLRARDDAQSMIDMLSEMTPVGRIGTGDEVAHTLVYAIENDFVNGVTLIIDGGRSAGGR